MKLRFKIQEYQTRAVEAVVDCFAGQPPSEGITYRVDPGKSQSAQVDMFSEIPGLRNADLAISEAEVLRNIQEVQKRQNLPVSQALVTHKVTRINLDIEMETGTGKTYCYIKTMFELNRRYGWNKFIVVVPSIAIREGVYKSLKITADHFKETYHKTAKYFIYNSGQLHNLENYSKDAGINIMVINVQAFNARGKDQRRIYEELDDFQSRKPIDVIRANRPILILDEPQKMEGKKTLDSLKEFNPLMILRYSATHKTEYNKIHRLDALDAYNQKLVKKISVRGISLKNLTGTHAYLYLESIIVSRHTPEARLEMEVKQNNGLKRIIRKLKKGDNLFTQSNELDQYNGFVITEIDANKDQVEFKNGVKLTAGEAIGNVNEAALRRIQIREAVRAHFEKEKSLFPLGIKTLSLFFIDEVAKYRQYTENGETGGEYARIFEEEYQSVKGEILQDLFVPEAYRKYLEKMTATQSHNGYFSIDKTSKQLVDPKMNRSEQKKGEANDVDAYQLILKDKERLLSFAEPTRFIFSHSALREGWDNPNVFVICTLKHSQNVVSRRQEVGRGLRISVNQQGERQDDPATVHQTNVLTVVASESYKDFVAELQKDMRESLSARPRLANVEYFTHKTLMTETGPVKVTEREAKLLHRYLIQNNFIDIDDHITPFYHEAIKNESLPPFPQEIAALAHPLLELVNSVFSEEQLPEIENDRGAKINPLNDNFEKEAFKKLWSRINHKAVYSVHFDTEELIGKCVQELNRSLRVTPLQYTIQRGEQLKSLTFDQMNSGEAFKVKETTTQTTRISAQSSVKYDLVGKIGEGAQLTRQTVVGILSQLEKAVFDQFKTNPESFIAQAIRLINEQKATAIIEHLSYDTLTEKHSVDIFTDGQAKMDFSNAGEPLERHIYDYVITDSKKERAFVTELDTSTEVVVYAKLPKGFSIPTPVGNYNPDWAIAFSEEKVKHIYFVAETKGSMSSLELRQIEQTKIECARKFFAEVNRKINPGNVKYDVVDSFGKLMEIVGQSTSN